MADGISAGDGTSVGTAAHVAGVPLANSNAVPISGAPSIPEMGYGSSSPSGAEADHLSSQFALHERMSELRLENAALFETISLLSLEVRQLRKQNAAHWELLGRLPNMLLCFDSGGIITFVSPSCFGTLGYTPREMGERSLAKFLTPDSQRHLGKFAGNLLAVRHSRAPPLEVRQTRLEFRKKNGSLAQMAVLGHAWQSRSAVDFVVTLTPIAEQFARHTTTTRSPHEAAQSAAAVTAAAAAAPPPLPFPAASAIAGSAFPGTAPPRRNPAPLSSRPAPSSVEVTRREGGVCGWCMDSSTRSMEVLLHGQGGLQQRTPTVSEKDKEAKGFAGTPAGSSRGIGRVVTAFLARGETAAPPPAGECKVSPWRPGRNDVLLDLVDPHLSSRTAALPSAPSLQHFRNSWGSVMTPAGSARTRSPRHSASFADIPERADAPS